MLRRAFSRQASIAVGTCMTPCPKRPFHHVKRPSPAPRQAPLFSRWHPHRAHAAPHASSALPGSVMSCLQWAMLESNPQPQTGRPRFCRGAFHVRGLGPARTGSAAREADKGGTRMTVALSDQIVGFVLFWGAWLVMPKLIDGVTAVTYFIRQRGRSGTDNHTARSSRREHGPPAPHT